jgi:hypothetical protein
LPEPPPTPPELALPEPEEPLDVPRLLLLTGDDFLLLPLLLEAWADRSPPAPSTGADSPLRLARGCTPRSEVTAGGERRRRALAPAGGEKKLASARTARAVDADDTDEKEEGPEGGDEGLRCWSEMGRGGLGSGGNVE